MIKSYFKTGFRNIKKESLSSLINILGLTAGVLGTMLIVTYIHSEISYDNFHKNGDSIFRILTISGNPQDKGAKTALTMVNLKKSYQNIEGVEHPTRLFKIYQGATIKHNGKLFKKLKGFYTDNNFFKLFSFKPINGNIKEALNSPESVVLNRSTALKLFGKTDIAGQTIMIEEGNKDSPFIPFTISAVIEDTPENSHFKYGIFLPLSNVKWLQKIKSNEIYNYFAVKKGYPVPGVLAQIKSICDKIYKTRERRGYKAEVGFQKLTRIHLHSTGIKYPIGEQGNIQRIYVFAAIPFILLFIASLNYINILIAGLRNRLKEIGLRKVIGADKKNLILQFLVESTGIAITAGTLSTVLYFNLIKGFGVAINKDLTTYTNNWEAISALTISLSLLIGIISSIYPSIIVSRNPVKALYGAEDSLKQKTNLMNFTVLAQFAIVTIIISTILVVYRQLDYMKNIDPGFNRNQVIKFVISKPESYRVIKSSLESNPMILSIALSQSSPGETRSSQILNKFDGKDLGTQYNLYENRTGPGFIKTYGIQLLTGRDFIEDNEADRDSIIVNQEVINKVGSTPQDSIGKKLGYRGKEYTIIGVIKDYHYSSLKTRIEPLVLSNYRKKLYTVSIKFKGTEVSEVLKLIESVYKSVEPDSSFNGVFIDQLFKRMYIKEEIFHKIVVYGAIIAVLLAMGGLFALTWFAVTKKTKEIGIRKVLGASTSSINRLLVRNFFKWIGLANLIAWPVAYIIINAWLKNFAYTIQFDVSYFIISTLVSGVLAFSTIIYLTTKAASQKPVDNIMQE